MTLWEILKANKTGIAPDMFTMLAASKMNGGRDRLHELSGTPPLSFTAKGKPLTAWSITGNTVQDGTPTPENPVEVQSVGDYDSETGMYKIPVVTREKNLFDYNLMFQNSVVYNDYFNVYNLVLNPYTEYEISTNGEEKIFTNPLLQNKETQFIVCNTSELFSTVNGGVSYKKKLFKTTGADGVLVVGYRTKYSQEGANIVNKADMDAGILWLNIIQTPITTPIYLPTPLYSGEVMRSDGSREVKWGVVDLGSLNWSYKTRFTSSIISNAKIFPNTLNAGAFCPLYQCVSANTVANGKFSLGLNNKAMIYLQDDNYTSLENFKQAMQGVMLYYKLATPKTETFTAPQIPTINGTTVIDVDTAVKPESMTIKYRR